MKKTLISIVLTSFLAFAFIMPAGASEEGKNPTANAKNPTLQKIEKKIEAVKEKINSLKPKNQTSTTSLACMQSVVYKRESGIIEATKINAPKVKDAFMKRVDGLKAAWQIQDKTARRTAIKKVWKDYNASIKTIKKDFKNAVKNSWNNFYKDRKKCGDAKNDEYFSEGVDLSL